MTNVPKYRIEKNKSKLGSFVLEYFSIDSIGIGSWVPLKFGSYDECLNEKIRIMGVN